MQSSTNQIPEPECDVVMKGGITSGIVYPLAVCELAERYRFRNVGGTSAGAIAAAVTAAAEHGRQTSTEPGAGFDTVKTMPTTLGHESGGVSKMLSLFQPEAETKPILDVCLSAMQRKPKAVRALSTALTAVRRFPRGALIGAAPGLALATLIAVPGTGGWRIAMFVPAEALSGLFALGGAVGGAAAAAALHFVRALPENDLGLCRGLTGPNVQPEALTNWLSNQIQTAAGLDPNGQPLTFETLWGEDIEDPNVNLKMMTTCLTRGRPYDLPFRSPEFYFEKDEIGRFFPDNVVAHMVRQSKETVTNDEGKTLRLLPDAGKLPVIVATRLSLSFPVLLSALPLYAAPSGRLHADPRELKRCWFSDGGICSNFPLHFFDAPFPRHPTFGIDLARFPFGQHEDENNQRNNVSMPTSDKNAPVELYVEIPQDGFSALKNFGVTIKNAMQNWRDNTQIGVPGYRDRVAYIYFTEEEGGLNLTMPPGLLGVLSDRGKWAGRTMACRFLDPQPKEVQYTWDNHRWVRFRSTLAVLQEMFDRMKKGYDYEPPHGVPTYDNLFDHPPGDPFGEDQKPFAKRTRDELLKIAGEIDFDNSLEKGAPVPEPELRILPKA